MKLKHNQKTKSLAEPDWKKPIWNPTSEIERIFFEAVNQARLQFSKTDNLKINRLLVPKIKKQ